MFLCIENKVNAYTDPGVGPHNLRNFYVNYKYVDLNAGNDFAYDLFYTGNGFPETFFKSL